MCGVFGFASVDGKGPDLARLRKLAIVTETRGDHAFGLAWVDHMGRMFTFKLPGPAHAHLKELGRCRDAVVLVGHCRFATHGSPRDNRNNHPHAAGGGWLVHNGVVLNHSELIARHRLQPISECDSEALALLMAKCPGTIGQRAAWAANQALGDLAMLGIWRDPARLLVVRRGRPLHFGQDREGLYLASLPLGLPGKVKAIADRTARVLVFDGAVSMDGEAVPLISGDM